jgi:hypothetical protein
MTKPPATDDAPETTTLEFEDSLDSFVGNEESDQYSARELAGRRIPRYSPQPEGWGLND